MSGCGCAQYEEVGEPPENVVDEQCVGSDTIRFAFVLALSLSEAGKRCKVSYVGSYRMFEELTRLPSVAEGDCA